MTQFTIKIALATVWLAITALGPAYAETSAVDKFLAKIDEARQLLQNHIARTTLTYEPTRKHRKVRFVAKAIPNIALAIKASEEPTRIIEIPFGSKSGYTIGNFTITWKRSNGCNTPIEVRDQNDTEYTVLRLLRPLQGGDTCNYTPYTKRIDTPEMRRLGLQYLKSVFKQAQSQLENDNCGGVVDTSDTALKIAITEHMDLSRADEGLEQLAGEVLVLLAANESVTFNNAKSAAKTPALGLAQFIEASYRKIRHKYLCARLAPDFVAGMKHHINAAKAMLLYAGESEERYSAIKGTEHLQLIAAAYNTGSANVERAEKAASRCKLITLMCDWRMHVVDETKKYIANIIRLDPFIESILNPPST